MTSRYSVCVRGVSMLCHGLSMTYLAHLSAMTLVSKQIPRMILSFAIRDVLILLKGVLIKLV